MSRRNRAAEAAAAGEFTRIQKAALLLLADEPGHYPSSLAYSLLDKGVLKLHHRRGRWTAQGAGMIGGKILAELWRAGLARRAPTTFAYTNRHELTAKGEAAVALLKQQETPHAAG